MIKLKRPGPLWQMTLALVTMTVSILLLADLLLGGSGSRDQAEQALRKQLSESLAVQTAVLLRAEDPAALDGFLREVLQRMPELRSAGVRRDDGELVASAGPHAAAWQRGEAAESTMHNVRVALSSGGKSWGAVELAYRADTRPWWQSWIRSPLVQQSLFVALVGAFGFALYMRRALQHLDPSAVIPERVQRAFDVMAEGVVVVDARGRLMLANRAFHDMSGGAEQVRIGQPLSEMAWLKPALPADLAAHPWNRAMAGRENTSDDPLRIRAADAQDGAPDDRADRRLTVNCAPITDNAGAVRGCMATFSDMTELHRANVALRHAVAEVRAGKDALQRTNQELQHLATRDALSGCLNRRAFMEAATQAMARASQARRPLGCLMLDIDHFKAVNDTHGHGIGDRVIAEVAKVLQTGVEAGHLVGRYGGEEFCIVAPDLPRDKLLALGERIRAAVQDLAGRAVAEVPGLRVTISVGASELAGHDLALAGLIDRADQALYRAKRSGRNRVAEFTAPIATEAAATT
jgi:diguanylate cyclase (GGDEF)-like protein/PAS domain S-box-containing protein